MLRRGTPGPGVPDSGEAFVYSAWVRSSPKSASPLETLRKRGTAVARYLRVLLRHHEITRLRRFSGRFVARAIGVLVALGLATAFVIVQLKLTRPTRATTMQALLERQNREMLTLVSAAERGKVLDFSGMLIVVDQTLVQALLREITPIEGDVGSGFHVRIDSADAAFRNGVALVTLIGTASVKDGPEGAKITVLGAIDVARIDKGTGMLQCGVSILGVDAQDAGSLGGNDPIGRLTEALAHGGISLLLGSLEIPVRIADTLVIPPVVKKRIRIEPQALPLTVSAREIKVFGGRLWVFVDVQVAGA
jgi:hypothetical protein